MRLLQLHSDFIEYEPISKEIKDAEENVSKTKVRLEDLVVTLIAIEVNDDKDIANNAVNEIKKYMDTVKSRRLLIYPYAHLSSCLASPAVAAEIIKLVEQISKELLDEVYRAPFGWTKAFQIKVKGHPLAENAKVVTKQYSATTNASNNISTDHSDATTITTQSEEKVSSALKAEEKLQSFWYV
ncbi:MAG: threonyl-tRNA synthetase editing domain-containing protein, partial [Nitrososphaeraceae archaeon]